MEVAKASAANQMRGSDSEGGVLLSTNRIETTDQLSTSPVQVFGSRRNSSLNGKSVEVTIPQYRAADSISSKGVAVRAGHYQVQPWLRRMTTRGAVFIGNNSSAIRGAADHREPRHELAPGQSALIGRVRPSYRSQLKHDERLNTARGLAGFSARPENSAIYRFPVGIAPASLRRHPTEVGEARLSRSGSIPSRS
jgi:hypothetical protein